MVSPGPPVRLPRGRHTGKRKRLHPPQDIREGVTNALQIVREVCTQIFSIQVLFCFFILQLHVNKIFKRS